MLLLSVVRTAAVLAAQYPTAVPIAPVQDPVEVAAISYPGGTPALFGCTHDLCAFDKLVRAAADQGARLVVLSEYALPQREPEQRVAVGQLPEAADSPLQSFFSVRAAELGLFLAIDLETVAGEDTSYNTLVAFGPDGRVVARHDKFELFEGERAAMVAGTTTSVFDTPFGRVGLLVCADLYGEPAMHIELIEKQPRIIAFSAAWTVRVATRWQAAFAHDWGVAVVGANASQGSGRGGGIFDRSGRSVAERHDLPFLLTATLGGAPKSGSVGSKGAP